MKRDIFFVLKNFFLAAIIVLLLQIKVGHRTFEEHITVWLQTSSIVLPLHDVASGSVEILKKFWTETRVKEDASSQLPDESEGGLESL